MPERPVILFPSPDRADRNRKPPAIVKLNKPQVERQYSRLQPTFTALKEAFDRKNVIIRQNATGMNPDFALVFEVVGSVENFYTAVKHSDGLEWLFDIDSEKIEPDEDFFGIDENGERVEKKLDGKLYCVMSNQQAIEQILSLWKRYKEGEDGVFERGFSGLRDVFTHVKNIRKWEAIDRYEETGIIQSWRNDLAITGDMSSPFEIELFYRKDENKRNIAANTVRSAVSEFGGEIISECVIPEIAYHALLAILPRNVIETLVEQYDSIALSHIDDIMFFRPGCQSNYISILDNEQMQNVPEGRDLPTLEPIAAILDGMPVQNHPLLHNRIMVDDPDDFATNYEAKKRVHGTAMTSLAIYGDLNRNEEPIKHLIYIRPIMRPKEIGPDQSLECIPENTLLVDLIQRAIKRIKEGENDNPAVAPTVHIINLSIGDPSRQLINAMSPVARIIDYLAYKHKLLFIISAGNHPDVLDDINESFQDLKGYNIFERNKVFWTVIKNNQRNLRLLSPAESINGLTIGAIYDDFSNAEENVRSIWAVQKGMPSPFSSIGKGYNGIVAPDLMYYGGRKYIVEGVRKPIRWNMSSKEPGCKVAAPYRDGTETGQGFSFGTSDAAAQITHEAINCYDILSQVFYDETGDTIPRGYEAIILKAMLAHGASWESFDEELSRVTGDSEKLLEKWAGYGVPQIDRVKECTKERITLIGYGELKKEQGAVYKLPLSVDFSSRVVGRKLTVTLSYLSPIRSDKQAYRSAQLWFDIDDGGKHLFPKAARRNSDWRAVRKGTLQHEIFVGSDPIAWNDDVLKIKVNCTEDADKLYQEAIPYCIFVTFEVAEGLDIDLYNIVRTQIRQRVAIQQ